MKCWKTTKGPVTFDPCSRCLVRVSRSIHMSRFSIKGDKALIVKKTIELASKVNECCQFGIREDKIIISCISNNHDLLTIIRIPKNYFNVFEFNHDEEIPFDAGKISKSWRKAGIGKFQNEFSVEINDENHVFSVISDGVTSRIETRHIVPASYLKDLLNFEEKEKERYLARIIITPSEIARMMKEFNSVNTIFYINIVESNKVHFSPISFKFNEFSTYYTTDKKKCAVNIKKIKGMNDIDKMKIAGSYSIEFLENILPLARETKTVHLLIGKYTSMNVIINISSERTSSSSLIDAIVEKPVTVAYFIAPRFEDDTDEFINEIEKENEERKNE